MHYDIQLKGEAREITDFHFFQMMLPDEWTATPTTEKYAQFDATTTNGKEVVYVELKGRDLLLNEERIKEGAYIDCGKADYLATLPAKAAIVQFFWKNNKTYVWNIAEKDTWKKEKRLLRKNNETDEKVLKDVYVLPFDDKNARYNVDLTDYSNIFHSTWAELSENNIAN